MVHNSTDNNGSAEGNISHTDRQRIVAFGLSLCICIMGTIGSSLMIHIIRTSRCFNKRFRPLAMNLSVLGLISALLAVPIHMSMIYYGHDIYGHHACQMIGFANVSLFFATLGNLIAIAVQRCITVTRAPSYRTSRQRLMEQVFLWIVPCGIALLGFPLYGYSSNQLYCSFSDEWVGSWVTTAMVGVPGLTILISICICYIVVCCKVRKGRSVRLKKSRKITPIITIAHIEVSPSNDCATYSSHGIQSSYGTPSMQVQSNSVQPEDVANNEIQADTEGNDERASWAEIYSKDLKFTVRLCVHCSVFMLTWAPILVLYTIVCWIDVGPGYWLSFSILARIYSSISWLVYVVSYKNVRKTIKTLCK